MSPRLTIYLLLLLLTSCYGAASFKKLSAPFKLLTGVIITTLASELVSRYLAKTIQNSRPPYHFFIGLEYLGFALIYSRLFMSEKLRRIALYSVPFVAAISAANTLFYQGLLELPSNALLVEHVALVCLSLLLFRQMFFLPTQANLSRQEVFWFNAAVLLYYALDFLVWAVHNYFERRNFDTHLLDTFNYVINLAFYFALGIAIFLNRKKAEELHGSI